MLGGRGLQDALSQRVLEIILEKEDMTVMGMR